MCIRDRPDTELILRPKSFRRFKADRFIGPGPASQKQLVIIIIIIITISIKWNQHRRWIYNDPYIDRGLVGVNQLLQCCCNVQQTCLVVSSSHQLAHREVRRDSKEISTYNHHHHHHQHHHRHLEDEPEWYTTPRINLFQTV